MKSVYKDQNITLRNMRMMQFDPSHDLPALIETIARRPQLVDIQDRTLVARVLGLVTARKESPTTLLIGVDQLSFLTGLFLFLFGNSSPKRRILSLPPQPSSAEHPLVEDLLNLLKPDNVMDNLASLIAKAALQKDFLIALLSASNKDDIRSVVDLMATGRLGVLLVKNYGMLEQAGHHEYCRDRGLRIVQLPDGSAELWNLNF